MSTAIDFLKERGLTVRNKGKRLVVSPASKITHDVRLFVKTHRIELLAELAANDGLERRTHWQVIRNNKLICTMVGEPMTYAEALEAIRYRWPDAELQS